MTTINPNTKKARELVANYRFALVAELDLFGAYARPSEAKREAWQHCKYLCRKMRGTHLCVTGKNCMTFGAGFQTETHIVYITKSNTYLIPKNA